MKNPFTFVRKFLDLNGNIKENKTWLKLYNHFPCTNKAKMYIIFTKTPKIAQFLKEKETSEKLKLTEKRYLNK